MWSEGNKIEVFNHYAKSYVWCKTNTTHKQKVTILSMKVYFPDNNPKHKVKATTMLSCSVPVSPNRRALKL